METPGDSYLASCESKNEMK